MYRLGKPHVPKCTTRLVGCGKIGDRGATRPELPECVVEGLVMHCSLSACERLRSECSYSRSAYFNGARLTGYVGVATRRQVTRRRGTTGAPRGHICRSMGPTTPAGVSTPHSAETRLGIGLSVDAVAMSSCPYSVGGTVKSLWVRMLNRRCTRHGQSMSTSYMIY